MQCDACGAPIQEEPVRGFVTCKYCGVKTRMAGGTAHMPAAAPLPVPGGLDHRRLADERHARARHVTEEEPAKRGTSWLTITIVLLAIAVPLAGAGLALRREAGVRTFSTSVPCHVQIDGDGVPDLIGVGYAGNEQHVVAIDGANGSTLWVGELMPAAGQAFCADATSVLTTDQGFSIAAVDVHTGAKRWTVRLADHVTAVSAAPAAGCVLATLADNSVVGLSLANGTAMPCPDARVAPTGDPYALHASAEGAGLRFAITPRPQGTAVLTVSAMDASGNVRWAVQLDALAEDRDDGGFVGFAANRVVTVGMSLLDSERFVMTTLDPATGRVLARVEESEGDSNWHDASSNAAVWIEGNRLCTHGFVAIACYDVTTLAKLWDVGM